MSRRIVVALSIVVLASSAAADTIYKVRLKDGTIVFTDRPPPGATVLEKREFESLPPPPPLPKKPAPAPATDASTAATERARAEQAVVDAEHALAQAKEALEKGREPREGDFIGTVRKGLARPSPAYEQRVRSLEQAVADAEARLAKAREAAR